MQSLFERRTKERTSQLLEKNYGQKSIPSMYCIPNKYHHPPLTCRCTQANKQIVSVINGCAAALTWNLQIFLGGLQTRMRGQRYSSLDLGEFPVWQLREHIKWRRKNIYFRALSKSPPFPPSPHFGQLGPFFGRQQRRFVRVAEKSTNDDKGGCPMPIAS